MKKLWLALLFVFVISIATTYAQQRPGAAAPKLVIMPPIGIGIIIGLYEFFLLTRDVQIGGHKFGHGITAVIIAVAGCIFSFNVPLVYMLVPQLKGVFLLGSEVGVRVLLGIIIAAKVHGASAALKGAGMNVPGMSETWFHSFLIGGLVGGSPYLYPFVQPMLPTWLK